MKEKFTNHLIYETSAYLLQHAHNPVNWYAWGEEALHKAKQEDKPVLVSIGYSACHWCHVMERESFEDEETAELMNRYFINIKIDREERPDLDHIYMDAVQTITGSGGWPLNVFLTPGLRPFYGGTYFPPVAAYNRNSWKEVLSAVANAYQTKKKEIESQADNLIEHLSLVNELKKLPDVNESVLSNAPLKTITENLLNGADKYYGGFGNAPKFPQTFSILYLLRYYYFFGDEAALQQAILSLDTMMRGGIYDHLGGGFARYSTDKRWQVPHFEKMLYDNALLIETYTEAYQLTKNENYAAVVKETIQFIQRELTSDEGGFYSALDADSEGVEGKYYVWSKEEIDSLLNEDSEILCSIYNVTADGNWEKNANILWQPEKPNTIREMYGLEEDILQSLLTRSKKILFKERQKRICPLLDAKIILSWNALMIKSLCKAYAAFGDKTYLNMAESATRFIETNMRKDDNVFYHSWNKILNMQQAFLDDYAALIQSYIHLSAVTANDQYLTDAKSITEKVIKEFSDEDDLFFYFTSANQQDVIIRKKEIYDGATPSGNALMAENFLYLSLYFDATAFKEWAAQMQNIIKQLVQNHPLSFGYWALSLQAIINGLKEIVITGNSFNILLKSVLQEYIPLKIIQASGKEKNNWPLLRDKLFSDISYIYLCENYTCFNPCRTIDEFIELINQNNFDKKISVTK